MGLPSTSYTTVQSSKFKLVGKVLCLKENAHQRVEVLDQRMGDDGESEVYVHYEGKDRRYDEWLQVAYLKTVKSSSRKRHVSEEQQERRKAIMKEPGFHPSQTIIDYSSYIDKQYEQETKVKYIKQVVYGGYEMDTWYFSPYPDEYRKISKMYVCDRCMLYMRTEQAYRKHIGACSICHPPGREIFRENKLSIYEVDGGKDKLFAQCLLLFSKCFLDHKTIYFYVADYKFYVLCEDVAEYGFACPVGYFSKELCSPDDRNLNCLVVYPAFQRKGYGQLLIQLSYELSRREGVLGSPEKPLSDLGLASFRNYWAYLIVEYLLGRMENEGTTISDLSKAIWLAREDVYSTLEWLQLIDDPGTDTSVIFAPSRITFAYLRQLRRTLARPPKMILSTRLVRWKPDVDAKIPHTVTSKGVK